MVPRLWSASLVLLAILCTTAQQDTLLHPKVAKSAPSCTSKAHRSTGSTQSGDLVEGECAAANQGAVQVSWEEVGGMFIVRFTEYKMAVEHRRRLEEGLAGSQIHWNWVDRQNSAAQHPTDFGLLNINVTDVDTAKAALGGLSFVKDVHPERRVTRALMWAEGDSSHDSEGRAGCSLWQEDGDVHAAIRKRPGRLCTRPTLGLDDGHDELWDVDISNSTGVGQQRRKLLSKNSVTAAFSAQSLWSAGYLGTGVKMGVFDTGIRQDHPHVKNIKERTNWTHEPTLEDGLGHGTFVAGVVAGSDAACPGFAADVDIHTFRVFTNDQVSFTSWFLDAFNYAIATEMNVVNLSIGGPDYLDQPFVEKVWEITSNGIIMVSAIGNDGPLYGTLNNPADQNDVLGVGGIDYADKIASFSSRGMSTWELPRGYGRSKPDVVAYGRDVMGSRIQGGCRSLSGTSVASPVVAGAVCLLASVVPEARRWHMKGGILNPASMKQALVEGAMRIPGINLYEQGAGKMNLLNSMEILQKYEPRASVVPAELNFMDCPYMWPFCTQPLYAGAMPLMFNATVLNGMGLTGVFAEEPTFISTNDGGKLLDVRFEHSHLLWPWSGFLALYIRVSPEGASYKGWATGEVAMVIESPPERGEKKKRRSLVKLGIKLEIIPTPPREKRILWDQFHSVRYPPAYIPRDSLDVRNDILDWHGDHPHTNYHDMFNALRAAGFFLEVLGSPLTCFDASQYGALLMVDLEEEYYPEEIAKLEKDVEAGLGVIVFGEWYNVDTMVKMRFFDDNTRSWWTPITGGANVPALNELLAPYGIAFGDAVLEGQATIDGEQVYYASGTNIVRFPVGGYLHALALGDKAATGTARSAGRFGTAASGGLHAVLGLTQHNGGGRVAVYGDSNCLDSSHMRSPCFRLLAKLLQYVATGTVESSSTLLAPEAKLAEALGSEATLLPVRRADVDATQFSSVLTQRIMCHPNAPLEFQQHPMPGRNAHPDDRAAAVTKMRNDAVVVPLRQQAPSNASGDSAQVPSNTEAAAAANRGATNPLTSVDPDLADAAATSVGIAGEQKKKGTAEGKPGALGEGEPPPAPGGQGEARGASGLPIEEAFRNASVNGSRSDLIVKKQKAKRGKGVSSSLNWFGQFTDGESGRPAPPAVQRKRSLFLDTMQFMPQLLAVAGALAVLGLWTLSRRVSRGRAPAPASPSRPSEALGATAFLRSRNTVRQSTD
ncbi:g2351 [Coccomyxa elongata]